MIEEPMILVTTSDIAGKTRGKAFPAALRAKRAGHGIGWTPTNVQITCFDAIADSPYGALDDLLLVPDFSAHVSVDFEDGSAPENFVIGDILSLAGEPWECCTRSILKGALARLRAVAGVTLRGAFEHEFHLRGSTIDSGGSYTLAGFRARARFANMLMGAIGRADLSPDTFMKEYGNDQYEVTISPENDVRIADAAIIVRELVHATALRLGETASFTPIRDPAGVGNGVHVHLSFLDAAGDPATYDAEGPHGMSALTASFAAGVLKYVGSIVAFTAPSAISFQRLTPHRWSAAYDNLGLRDREAPLRICPVSPRKEASIANQFNIEYRAADAAASPYLALAAIVHAGVQGIEEKLPAPPVTSEDLSLLEEAALAARGYRRLPASLPEALDRLAGDRVARSWFPGRFVDVYLSHKRGELAFLEGKSLEEQCAAYERVY